MKLLRSTKVHIAAGLLLIAVGGALLWWRSNNAWANAAPATPAHSSVQWAPVKPDTIYGAPTHLSIPSLKISLPVIPGVYDARTQSWTLTDTSVQYATITPPANNAGGNTFLYAHALTNLFGNLHTIKPGAQAIIATANGHTFTYTFMSSRQTTPNDDSLFTYKGSPILTLQTCSGWFYQYRQLFTFKLTNAK